jgi:LacI family transcriptional regulator
MAVFKRNIIVPDNKPQKVALVFPMTVSWLSVLAEGVADYARQKWNCDFTTSPPTLDEAQEIAMNLHTLKGWAGDGAIAVLTEPEEARLVSQLDFPVVCISGNLRDCETPRVMVDQYAVGRMAAEHLLNLGLRRLAYYGLQGLWYSRERQRGFADRAVEAGVPCQIFETSPNYDRLAALRQRREPVHQWLKTLQLPIGILAVHDYRARVVADECSLLGYQVPHDVAILGVDNDLTACEFSQLTLSSVSVSAWKVGFEAARLLGDLISGRPKPEQDILIPPDGVIRRRSTDTIIVGDKNVSMAVQYMRDHLSEPFGIEQVMRHVPVSRRRLHEQFQRLLNRTPYEYLCHLRVEQAKKMLSMKQRLKMHKIAKDCGFTSAARLRLVFHRVTGMTPLEFHRLHGEIVASKSPDRGEG